MTSTDVTHDAADVQLGSPGRIHVTDERRISNMEVPGEARAQIPGLTALFSSGFETIVRGMSKLRRRLHRNLRKSRQEVFSGHRALSLSSLRMLKPAANLLLGIHPNSEVKRLEYISKLVVDTNLPLGATTDPTFNRAIILNELKLF